MAVARTYVRYAHGEGHAGLAYLDSGARLVSAGGDGELRIWDGVEDDDPESHRLGDALTALAVSGDRVLVGTEAHAVSVFRLPSVKPDGVVTRYTAAVSDICVSGSLVASAGCDMVVRVTTLDGEKQREIDSFTAPVLSVALCPAAKVLLTTCCDGNATFWDARSGKRLSQHALLPKCNDVTTAKSLARPGWSPDGRLAAVPVADGVRLFSGDTWAETGRLTSHLVSSPLTVCTFSPCGLFLAAATYTGALLEWRLAVPTEARLVAQHEGGLRVNVLLWHPGGDQLAYTDCAGQLGTMSGVSSGRGAAPDSSDPASAAEKADDELLGLDDLAAAVDEDDDDDRDLLEAALDGEQNTLEVPNGAIDGDEDDDDENVISLGRIKAESGFQQNGLTELKGAESARTTPVPPAAAPAPRGPAFAEPQPPFQPGSTPDHLESRFLVWNSVGVVTSHEGDSLDVAFHDAAIHHPLHVRNTFGHTMAALSEQALSLAAPAQGGDTPSKLQCLHFGSWDSNKEWFLDLPTGEEAEALALGDGWLAVATSARHVRLMTLTGVQKEVLSVAGPVVCLAGWERRLLVVYHSGTGLPGEQQLVAQVLSTTGRRHPRPAPLPVPLSPRARLTWAGFSDQGSACVFDTAGSLRLLSDGVWRPLEVPHPGSDHLFMVAVSEIEQTVRGLLCRGSRYPAVLPRPTLSVLSFKLPLAERDSDAGRLEEEAARASLLISTLSRLDTAGFDTEEPRADASRDRAAALTQLFALACRSDREHRALDVAAQMDSVSTVEAVAGYASRQRRARLAERLVQLAQALAEGAEEQESPVEVEEAEESYQRRRQPASRPESRQEQDSEEQESETQFEEMESEELPSLPDLARSDTQPVAPVTACSPAVTTPTPRNPFRCEAAKPASAGKGAAVFDDMKRQRPPAKRMLAEDKANSSAKMKRPRVSKKAAGKLTSLKSIFSPATPKAPSQPSAENEENEGENVVANTAPPAAKDAEPKPATKAGSGVKKLAAFAFSGNS